MSNRIFDSSSVERLSTLVRIARDNGLAISIDFIGTSPGHQIFGETWLVQIYDEKERLVVSAHAKNPNDVIKKVHENWFAKTAPKI